MRTTRANRASKGEWVVPLPRQRYDAAAPAFSQDAFRRAESRDKSLHIVEGATHIAMYDTPEFVKQAMAHLVPLYQNAGKASSPSNFVGPLAAHTPLDAAGSSPDAPGDRNQ